MHDEPEGFMKAKQNPKGTLLKSTAIIWADSKASLGTIRPNRCQWTVILSQS